MAVTLVVGKQQEDPKKAAGLSHIANCCLKNNFKKITHEVILQLIEKPMDFGYI